MNSPRKLVLTLAGILLISAAATYTWFTIDSIRREVPTVGIEDIFNRLHPEWHSRSSRPWQPCFGLCKEPFL